MDCLFDYLVDLPRGMPGEPVGQVELGSLGHGHGDGVVVEEVGHYDGEEGCKGEVIGETARVSKNTKKGGGGVLHSLLLIEAMP